MFIPVKDFEKFYAVNESGDILSLRTGKLRKPVLNKVNGYYYVVLCGDSKKRTAPVHRIVCEAFLPHQDGLDQVNHINEDKRDNRVENLEWCTKAYNNKYNGKDQRCSKPVVGRSLDDGQETIFASARIAGQITGAQYKNISAVCRGKRRTAGGYSWRFL